MKPRRSAAVRAVLAQAVAIFCRGPVRENELLLPDPSDDHDARYLAAFRFPGVLTVWDFRTRAFVARLEGTKLRRAVAAFHANRAMSQARRTKAAP